VLDPYAIWVSGTCALTVGRNKSSLFRQLRSPPELRGLVPAYLGTIGILSANLAADDEENCGEFTGRSDKRQ
jgi:hypothetical protein